ncbi:MAG: hypothetical protein FWH36_06335, partial [Lentimicrobiaceae bacterium]|nr:hypothetical protein [Lentimicrobiaceae bacterium]
DPLLPEDKKALINKNVWCEPCELTEPRRFKIENQYFGTISLDANLYQSVKLRVILDAVAKIPKEQQIFCKIKGIYPDGTFKLQWIVQWNERIRQLVFPNKFFQKIDIETEKRDKKQALIGTETWGIIKKNTGRNIVAIKDIYPAVLGEEDVLQNNLLQCLNRSTTVLCKVLSLENDGLFRIKWLFPEPSIFPDFTDTSSLEQRIGEEVWAEIKWIFSNKVIAWVEGKYLAIILGNGVLKAKYVHQILQKMFNVQVLCRIADVKNNVMQLEWLIDKNSDFLQNSSISQMDRNILSDILVEMEKTKNKKELKKGKKEKRRERQVEEQNKIREMMQEEEKMEIEEIEIEMEIEEEENKIRETLQIKEEMEMKRKERKKEKDKERKKGKRMKRREEKIEGQNKIREMMQTKEEIEEEIVPWEKQETESIKMETPILKPLTIVGKVDLDAINEKTKPRKKPKEELRKEQAERYRLEKEKQKTLKDLRAEKRKEKGEEDWKTKRKREKIDKKQNIEQAQLITENKTYLEQQYVGKTLWLELHKTRSMLIEFWIEGKYKAKMSISEKIYPNASCQNIKRALNESVEGQQFLCEVLEICPNCLTLRWKIEEDPLAKKYSVISGDFPEIEDKPQQMDETKSEENTEKQKKTFNIRNWFKW